MIKIVNNAPKYYQSLLSLQGSALPSQDKMSRENFLEEFSLPTRKYFVALNDKEVCGYIGLFDCDNDYNIISFAVLPSMQRHGIGSMLLNKAKTYALALGKKSLSLEVDFSNIQAINFYKKHGFVVTNIRKKYYKDKDAFVMFLYL